MMKKKMRFGALFLAAATLLSACGAETPASDEETVKGETEISASTEVEEETKSEYPEYLNLDSAYPIVKDEYADDITLTAAIVMQDNAGEWDDLWIKWYFEEKYNINLEVEYMTYGNRNEKKNLLFSSGELPDLIINAGIKNDEIMKYGVEEGLFLQIDQYINETLAPNIQKELADQEVKAAVTALDGHVYTLPYLSNPLQGGNMKRVKINTKWLKDLGLEIPKTLDEFVEAMYAIKEADPAGVGSENLYPFGGGDKSGQSNGWYLLNAFGYVHSGSSITADGYGIEPCLRDGEVVIPVYDMEVYQEYLKLMNQFYTDGIINPTYFTIEQTEMNAQVNEGRTAMYHNEMSVAGIVIEDPYNSDWNTAIPLTSEWQTEAEFPAPTYVGTGHFVISADTEYPELCVRFADMFFNNETDTSSLILYGGGSEWNNGNIYYSYIEEKDVFDWPVPEGVSGWNYRCENVGGNTWEIGTAPRFDAIKKYITEQGYPEYEVGEAVWEKLNSDALRPYCVTGFPSKYYMTAEDTARLNELTTLITPYVQEQVALFITGRRSLSETEDFVKELEDLGIKELLELYKEIYASVTE